MFGRLKHLDIRSINWRNLDYRAIATPIAVLSPVALIVSAQELVMTAVAILFLLHSRRERDWAWTREGWFAALAALWVYAFLRTLLLHPTATGVLTALQWIHFPVYAAALSTWILPRREPREKLLRATLWAMSFFAADCLFQFVVGHDIIGRPTPDGRLTSVFGKPGVGAEMGWLYLPAMVGLWARGYAWRAAGFGFACIAAILLTGDRMALLIALAAILILCLFVGRARKTLLIALPGVAVVLAALLYLSPWIYHRQVETTATIVGNVGESVYGLIFKTGLAIAADHPLLGVGVRNYQAVCVEDKYGPRFVGPREFDRCQGHPHDIWLQWLAETGAIGVVLYAAFAFLALRKLYKAAPANRDDLVYFALAICLALRLWPIETTTSFYSSWSAGPLFLVLGWALSYARPTTLHA